jgi:hypothetical protein
VSVTDPLIRSLELLAGVTPGRWRIGGTSNFEGRAAAHAAFIAESPTLVAALCEELKLARSVIAAAKSLQSFGIACACDDDVHEDCEWYQLAVDVDVALSAYQALIAKRGGEDE